MHKNHLGVIELITPGGSVLEVRVEGLSLRGLFCFTLSGRQPGQNMRSRHSQRPTTRSFCCAKILNWAQPHCVQGVGCVTCHGLIQHQLITVFSQLHLPQLRYHCISLSPDGSRRPLICHLNGVRFLTPEQREALGTMAGSGGGEVSGDGSLAELGGIPRVREESPNGAGFFCQHLDVCFAEDILRTLQ